ncbi:ankyrin repeat protein, putative [Trichomonas vaginalis G3]|uniref:Ankyrin repeat protein, putative n=1 Tax=Trichomonas vaginalis (strain ATCC PRA-98 / G3) TaxID=412133 RepID=A2FQ66_TRIV3|nr:spectrin binding [Trichomonas vaginalis G3]EAX92938.1 ankyrin repeat protein, putative [Trichomonas vaginalis G3]KAI5553171.1 spectrin binding [Trichomonas vaginalis G3]|eukprot:XP_001305868.1 ankyrin repeat protein [Trichomonas vaginalis G3]
MRAVKPDTIFESIMNDDIVAFTSFTEREDFDKNDVLVSPFIIKGIRYSLLEVCCYYGATKCFSFLREKFDSEITKRCLLFSILSGNHSLVKECLKVVEPDDECMRYAILSHNIAFVTFLMIEYKLTINLFYCGCYHNLQAFFVYLDQTNDIKECFLYSPFFNIPSLCQYFLDHGASINDRDNALNKTALHVAACVNAVETAKFLIANGAIVNIKDNNGMTPLQFAARHNSKEMIELLIANGAIISDRNNENKSALYLSTENDAGDAAEALILHGANVNDSYNYGETVLHVAADLNKWNIVSVLVSHGAIINAKEYKNESTALHKAAMKGNTYIVKILLSHGADVNSKDSYRKTALDYAKENGNEKIEKLLISHGAIPNSMDN